MIRHFRTLCMVGCAAVLVAGCGVKGDPVHPEGGNYPLTYPYVPERPAATQPVTRQRQSPTVPRRNDGLYQPPPPATEMPR